VTNERSRWNRDSDGVLRMNTQVPLRLGLSDLARALYLAFEDDTLRDVNEFGDLTFDHGQVARPTHGCVCRTGSAAKAPTPWLRALNHRISTCRRRALYWQRRPQSAAQIRSS
jgi:hypothetical protein